MSSLAPDSNLLLAMHPPAAAQRLEGHLTVIGAAAGDVLCDAGEPIDDIYFPLDCVVSLDQVIVPESGEPGAAPDTGSARASGSTPFSNALFAGCSRLTTACRRATSA